MMMNWKTTASGALMVLVGVASLLGLNFGGTPMSPDAAIASIMGGLGLIFAKDSNVTGGSVQQ